MDIYIVVETDDIYNFDKAFGKFIGAYSTEEKAKQAITKNERECPGSTYNYFISQIDYEEAE